MPWTYEHLKPKGKPDLLSDEVPWRAMIAPGVVLQKHDYALQRSYLVRGPDLTNESDEVQAGAALKANEVFKRLGGEWMLQSTALRTQVLALPPVAWPYPIPALIDARRRQDMLVDRESRDTTYHMTLTWTPPTPLLRRGIRYFIRGPGQPGLTGAEDDTAASARTFVRHADFVMDLLRGMLAVCVPLSSAETATYLHKFVSDRWYDLQDLADWNHLDHQLCDTPLDPAGWYPQLGDWHLRTMTIQGYPAESTVGIMRKLDAMNLDYSWSTRWMGMEKSIQQQFLKKTEAKWVNQEKSVFDRSMENFTGHQTRVIDPDATNKALDVNAARQEIGMDLTAYGLFTGTVTVWDGDPLRADTKLTAVMQAFADAGFTIRAEDEHLVAAWLSSHPGNRVDNVRRTPQSALTLAHLAPGLNATWPGPERDAYLDEGPWFYAQTEGSNLFRVVNHLRDLGHFLLLGDTRSGKSTLGNFMRAMWMQHPRKQAKVFDVDGHARLLTYLLGGRWYDLGSPRLRIQPLRHVDDARRRALLLQWLLDICEAHNVPLSAYVQMYLRGALEALATRLPARRTWDEFLRILTDKPKGYVHEVHNHRIRTDVQGVGHEDIHLRQLDQVKFEVQTALGEYATIFGGTEDTFAAHPVQTFELRDVTSQKAVLRSIMRYAMLEVSLQMTTAHPMFLLLDDAAIAWLASKADAQHPGAGAHGRKTMEEQADDWLQTSAKKGVSVGFSTHSPQKVLGSALGQIIIDSCKHRYFLPNRGAMHKHSRAVYDEMGLPENAIQTIALLSPQRDVLYDHEELGRRAFSLPLGPFELDCLARNDAEDHELFDKILAQEGPEGFTAAYLRHRGWEEEAYAVATWPRHHAPGDDPECVAAHADRDARVDVGMRDYAT
jgi:type IV secretory pathway VirB4 component